MAAIGQVESGRRDPVSGALRPWPWTVDAEGQGSFYDTKAQAIAAVRALQARGVRSIDVGLHAGQPDAPPGRLRSLEQAFDPMANADYAGRFLVQLHGQSGAWPKATAMYHSTTPDLGAAYEQKVMAVWPEQQLTAEAAPRMATSPGWGTLVTPGLFPPAPRRVAGARVLPRMPLPGGAPLPPGRGLAAYRATPIAMGWRRVGG